MFIFADMANILVTGGTGYIGSHTVVELLQAGHQVCIIDDFSNSEPFILERIEQITGKRPVFVEGNICNAATWEQLMTSGFRAEAVIHFAAYKSVGESVQQPLKYYENNLIGLARLLEWMGRQTVPHLVFSSSCTVYGQPEQLPVTENSPVIRPESPYGNTKKISEEIISDVIFSGQSLHAVILRYFNPIGAHPSGLIGELPRGIPNNLVPYITQTAAGIRKELHVFGNDYTTPDGSCIRDYIHVTDLALAHVKALEMLLKNRTTQNPLVYNLGTGQGTSVLETIRAFENATGVKVPYRITERRAGDIEQIWADVSLANRELGWKTQYSLEKAMEHAWNWQQSLGTSITT